MRQTLFITGTDTGVGKTLLTCLLAQFFRRRGVRVAAFKPVCSGGRGDALALRTALGGALTLDQINPWHFRASLAPSLAARLEKKSVKLAPVLAHIRDHQKKIAVTLIEGAGGLLSPLGVDFNSRDLMTALGASPVIVAPNRLGVVNHVLLSLEALPENLRRRTKIVLMLPPRPDAATASNPRLLLSALSQRRIFILPWLGDRFNPAGWLPEARVTKTLAALVKY